jgi:Zn-finger nucleic acid-binding protein
MTERQGVEIDYCPQCRGVWLDRGELDKIIERSDSQLVPRAPVNTRNYEPQRDSHNYENREEHYGRHKKKKSFLGEMFDFD